MSRMEQVLAEAKEVKPIAEKDGARIVSYEDAKTLQEEAMLKAKLGEDIDLGDVEVNPDGTIANTRTTIKAINEDRRLMNRYRVKKEAGKEVLQVVTDYLAVKQHDSGTIYVASVPVYELIRQDEELVLRGQTTVSDTDFVTKFKDILNRDAMYQVLEAISKNEEDVTTNEMPI